MNKMIYLITIFCFIYVSDLKPQWVQQTLPPVPGNFIIMECTDFINQDHGITGGISGYIETQQFNAAVYYTSDGGDTWLESSVPDSMRYLESVQMFTDSLAYGAGAYNLVSTNGLTNSNFLPLNKLQLQSIYEPMEINFLGQTDFHAYFVETTDGGLTWHPKGSFEDSAHSIARLSFINQTTGCVAGISPTGSFCILKTTDGGNSWYYVYPFTMNLRINDIDFIDNQNGIAAGEEAGNGIVLRTTDAGENWTKSYVAGTYTVSRTVYLNVNDVLIEGFTLSDDAFIYKSTDGGISWNVLHIFLAHIIAGMEAYQSSGAVLVYGFHYPQLDNTPFIDISLDGGNSWHYTLYPEFFNYVFGDATMVNGNRWYIPGSYLAGTGVVLFTGNSGGLPVELTSFTGRSEEGKVFLNWTTATETNNRGFGIERKSDQTDWVQVGFVKGKGTTTEVQKYSFIDNLQGIPDTKLDYRLKQIDFDGSFEYSDAIGVEWKALNSYLLEQNYPNPFNPATTIGFSIQERSNVKITVLNGIGEEVAVILNEVKEAGYHQVKFSAKGGSASGRNAVNLPSGVYFYQIKAGSFVKTKKMILLR